MFFTENPICLLYGICCIIITTHLLMIESGRKRYQALYHLKLFYLRGVLISNISNEKKEETQ